MNFKNQKEMVGLSLISDVICDYFQVDDKLLIFKPTRNRDYIMRRQWFHYFARILNPEHTVSLNTIGAYYSDITRHRYNHATILHSVRKIKGYLDVSKKDREIKSDIYLLIKLKLDVSYKPKLTANCAEHPFKITRYSMNT